MRDQSAATCEPGSPDSSEWDDVIPVLARTSDGVVVGALQDRTGDTDDPLQLRRGEKAEAECKRMAYLMAAAGHDLRQPLQVIALALDRIAQVQSPVGRREYLEVALTEVANVNEGLAELAMAARLGRPVFRNVSLSDVLRVAADGWRHHATANGLRLRVLQTKLTVRTEPRLLVTIVRNLVGNAVRHTRSGGVLVACRRRRGGVRIDVFDTGPGLPVEGMDQLFEPHRQGEPGGDGLGLGLALARDAAEQLGCVLSLCSKPGAGSCFSVFIP